MRHSFDSILQVVTGAINERDARIEELERDLAVAAQGLESLTLVIQRIARVVEKPADVRVILEMEGYLQETPRTFTGGSHPVDGQHTIMVTVIGHEAHLARRYGDRWSAPNILTEELR